MKKKIGVVFADEMEYRPFLDFAKQKSYNIQQLNLRGNDGVKFSMLNNLGHELEVVAVKCGIGKVNAASATAFLISDNEVDVIFNAGLSGAVSGLKREDIVVGTSFVEADFDLTAIGCELGYKPEQDYVYPAAQSYVELAREAVSDIKFGAFGTGDVFLADSEKKKLYAEKFNICSFDMETAAIASVCKKANYPFFSVRKISDDADDCATDDYTEMNDRAEVALSEILFSIFNKI